MCELTNICFKLLRFGVIYHVIIDINIAPNTQCTQDEIILLNLKPAFVSEFSILVNGAISTVAHNHPKIFFLPQVIIFN